MYAAGSPKSQYAARTRMVHRAYIVQMGRICFGPLKLFGPHLIIRRGVLCELWVILSVMAHGYIGWALLGQEAH